MRLPRLLTEPRNDGGVGIMCHCEERSDAAICVGDCRRNSGRGKPLPYGIAGSAGASPRLPLEGKLSPQATDEVYSPAFFHLIRPRCARPPSPRGEGVFRIAGSAVRVCRGWRPRQPACRVLPHGTSGTPSPTESPEVQALLQGFPLRGSCRRRRLMRCYPSSRVFHLIRPR